MSRRMWTGMLAGLLGLLVLVGVAAIAYKIGRGHEVVRTVGDREVGRVVGHGWGYGPGPGFFFFPLLLFGLAALLIWGARGWGGGGRPPWGPGPWTRGSPEGTFAEWHRRAHGEEQGTSPSAPSSPGGPGETGPPPTTM